MQHFTITSSTAGTEWMLDGACANTSPLDWFDEEHYQSAATVCDRCQVRSTCLEYAISNRIDDGMWGGLVPFQLRKAIQARNRNKHMRPQRFDEQGEGT